MGSDPPPKDCLWMSPSAKAQILKSQRRKISTIQSHYSEFFLRICASGQAQRQAHHHCAIVGEAVITHGTPLLLILHLKTAGDAGAAYKANKAVVARWAAVLQG